MHCWDRSSDKPSLAILLFSTVLDRGLLHVKKQTFKISALQKAKRTKTKKSACDDLPQDKLIISEWVAENGCSARCRR